MGIGLMFQLIKLDNRRPVSNAGEALEITCRRGMKAVIE